MSFVSHGQRLIAGLTVVLLALAATAVPATTIAADDPLELFYSEHTGYFYFWDPAIWSLEDEGESSDPAGDWLTLSDGEVSLDLWAFLAPGVTTSECLRMAVDDFGSDPTVLEMEALTAEGGPPQIGENVTNLVLTVDRPEGTEKFAVGLTCNETVPGESLHLKSLIVPASVYNARGLELWEYDFDSYFFAYQNLVIEQAFNRTVPIESAPGEVIGMFRAYNGCLATVLFVLAQGVGGNDFLLDPASFVVLDADGSVVPATLAMWSLPAARRESSLALRPGETALLYAAADARPAHKFSLYFTPPSGQAIELTNSVPDCGGASSSAPVLIDIE